MKLFIIILYLSLFSCLLFSCKKQEKPDVITHYDTLIVNQDFMEYSLMENTKLTLNAFRQDASAYLWMPVNDTSSSITIDKEGIFSVKITTHSQELNYQVLVYYHGSDCYIPNSFSPNGDNVNDTWKPLFVNVIDEDYRLSIFTADNIKVFETTQKDESWTGMHNGTLLPATYYYYILKYKTITNQAKERNGMIQLLQ